jgi:predicted Fe-Mo cluster-binding NifX family protein
MDDRFGRAAFFAFFNTDSGEVHVAENPHAGGSGGVGPQAVQFLVQNGVTTLIAPRLGGNAEEALVASKIQVIMQNPDVTVVQAFQTWKDNAGISA